MLQVSGISLCESFLYQAEKQLCDISDALTLVCTLVQTFVGNGSDKYQLWKTVGIMISPFLMQYICQASGQDDIDFKDFEV